MIVGHAIDVYRSRAAPPRSSLSSTASVFVNIFTLEVDTASVLRFFRESSIIGWTCLNYGP